VPLRLLNRAVALGLLVAALVATSAAAAPFVDGEFVVPGGFDSNNKIAAGPDGNVWMTVNSATNDVAKITPSGEVTEFDLEATNPLGITAGPDNLLWITRNGGVTRFSPANPVGTKDPIEVIEIVGNHAIVTGPDGNLWVATDNNLVKIPPNEPATKKEVIPVAGLSPKDIDVAGSLIAVADQNRIATFTTGAVQKDYETPGELSTQGVAGSPSGQIAFSDPLANPEAVGLITPPNPAQITEVPGDPFGVAFGSDGAFWIAETAGHSLTRLTPDNQTTKLTGFDEKLGPRQIAAGPGNTLWVTNEDFNNFEIPEKVARVSGVEAPAVPIAGSAPETRIVKGPKKRVKTKRKRAKVRFTFRSPDAAAKFECALQKLKKRKGKKGKAAPKPRFKPCKSPKKYSLKPGKYRFSVRAVLNGVADPTPAKRTFRIVRVSRG
jgi:streptogramin lyase